MGEFYIAEGCIKLVEQPQVATHTGVFNAVCCSMEGMDLQLGRLKAAIEKAGDGETKAKTSHSINPVPGIIYNPEYTGEYDTEKLNEGLGISSWPSTLMNLMGFVSPGDAEFIIY